MRRLLNFVLPCVLLSGCYGPGDGVEVPQDQIYFPVGLALDKDAKHLIVVSSDFDLQYNGGAVQSYRLNDDGARRGVVDALPTLCVDDSECGGGVCTSGGLCADSEKASPCGVGKDRADADRLLFPGRCKPLSAPTYQASRVKIGAFATDAILRQRADSDDQRLFVPVRGDATLHWLDLDSDGTLRCGQENADGACDDRHRAGDDPSENSRNIKLNAEPFALDATAHAENLVVTNQTTGTASLFVTKTWAEGPELRFALASDKIPSRPVGIAAVPPPAAAGVDAVGDTFMMTFRNSAQVRLIRFAADQLSAPDREYLVDGNGVPIDANSVGSDSRGVAIDDSARKAAEARCLGSETCLQAAALVPLDVYVANRAPSTLLIGRTTPPQQYPYFYQTIPLTTGPSRVTVGQIETRNPDELETRVFVVCFDSRRVFVYDPKRGRLEAEIFTGRGPHAVAVDTKRRLLYVGHFTDSYIGIYSLDLSHPATYGTLLGTLGTPKAPRASK